ncbi:MAG: alanine racemase, partial [Alphaproteobacteria bacterium]|nr:alanine racemase [Alphaproteobacteria bacterium]
ADQVELWRNRPRGEMSAALHIDTGMNRLGMPFKDGKALIGELADLRTGGIDLLMSHLVSAERPADAMNRQQLEAFRQLCAINSSVPASLANSAGVFLGPEYHYDMARVGISLYGGAPVAGEGNPMQPVVRVRARILQERKAYPGETVGYDALYRLGRESRLITIAAGYADGLPTVFTNRGFVAIEGQRAPMVGRVSMDLITVDVTDLPPELTKPGGWVDLIGPGAEVDDVAESAGLISYEVLTSLSHRFERVYSGGG